MSRFFVGKLFRVLDIMFYSYKFGGFERLWRPLARLRSWAWRHKQKGHRFSGYRFPNRKDA